MSRSSRPESHQLLAEYYFANPPPGSFLKRYLFGHNRRLLLQLQKAAAANGDTRGRAVPAYDVLCGGSFVRRLAGCFKNQTAKAIIIVESSSDETGETEGEKRDSALATITRVPTKDVEGDTEKLLITFFDGATWNCERAQSGGYHFTPVSGEDLNVLAAWEPEAADQPKRQGYVFSVSASVAGSSTPRTPTPRSPTPKSPGTPRKKAPEVLARMDSERVQVFGARSAPKGSFLGKMDEINLERMVLVSATCVRVLQGKV